MKYFRWLMIAAGLFIVCDTAVTSFFSNFTIGILMAFAVGALLLFWGVFYKYIHEKTKHGAARVIRIIAAAGLGAVIGLCGFFMAYGIADTVTYGEDAVIVLGCAVNGTLPTQPLAARLNTALEYSKKNPDAYIVVSGGQGFQEDISEAQCMAEYLVKRGVDEKRIIREDKASSTNENMKFSKELLDKRFGDGAVKSIAVITNDFHIFRSKRLAAINGMRVSSMHAATPWYNAIPMYLREILAVGKLILLRS